MTDPVLQFAARTSDPVSSTFTVAIAVLGLLVGYIAFRGYRRNESLPMLFVATGFLLTFWTRGFLLGVYLVLDRVGSFAPGMRTTVDVALSLAADGSTVVGLLCLLYGLWMPRREN
ncbi:hypothetical protein [Halorientalis regularis]|jgi:hypothetical protein|uniref:Uncharacterized protein n=1 Tax=Halorientalis regularis TaxID=660518 RepID=A0A1G7J864_9EURY|nr:hypothetical protein [Halorientalis regularis]SDF20689.1 hypothetical protein SAMN05216218_104226 [Halorientalis regularis]